jgi:2',3'-cyclic-nucleotide 2'-phosphodiesterase (5'-nucleotidase family)
MPALFNRKNAPHTTTIALLCACLLYSAGCLLKPRTCVTHGDTAVEILLLTTNDLHGRLEPFTIQGNLAPQSSGGFAALAAQMNMITKTHRGAVLRLNSGDTLTGPYAAHFNDKALFGGLNRMGIDAATLGNHEFDYGTKRLAQAIAHCSFPVVLTNIDIPAEHMLAEAIQPYALFERAGTCLLVVGLLTARLQNISSPGTGQKIRILEPDSADMRARIRAIIRRHNPDLVIALTHLGLDEDRRLAARIPEIDVICGGHSHDLMPAGRELTVKHADGRQTVIVQAGAGGSALGVLRIRLQPGLQPAYTWSLRKIDASSGQCQNMLAFIEKYRSELPPIRALTASETIIDCRAVTLRSREAPIGSFIADSLRKQFNTDAALYNGGGVRGDFILPAGPITSMDIETMLPYGNRAVVVSMPGAVLRQVLERSVAHVPQPWGGFLQVSGLRMRVDLQTSLPQQRITGLEIRKSNGEYVPLVPEKIYRIVTNSFLAGGGNGYTLLRDARTETPDRMLIRDIIMRRMAARPLHSFQPDGRITIQSNGNKR